MAPLRVAFVNQPWCSSEPPPTSSLEIWSYEVARRIAGEHDVRIFGSASPKALRTRSFMDRGVSYHFVPTGPDVLARNALAKVRAYRGADWPQVAAGAHYGAWINRVAWALRRHRPDVIHVHNQLSFVPHLRRFHPRAAIVLHMQSEWLSQLRRPDVERALRATDVVLTCSAHVLDRARSRHGSLIRHELVIPNGVDCERFQPGPASDTDELNVVFVGRVSPEKGCHDLIEAFAMVAPDFPGTRLTLVGSVDALPSQFIVDVSPEPHVKQLQRFYTAGQSDYWAQLQELIPAALSGRVVATGPISRDEVARTIRSATVLANPSLSETFGMALAEAMACGVPTLATTVGGMPEVVVDGETGFLVPPDSPVELADRLRRLLADKELRLRMGVAGRRRVESHFTWERVASEATRLYESASLLRRGAAAAPAARRDTEFGPGGYE